MMTRSAIEPAVQSELHSPCPCPHDSCWHSGKNATQMSAMAVRLTEPSVDHGKRPVSCGQGAGNCRQPGPEVLVGPGQLFAHSGAGAMDDRERSLVQ